MTPSRLSSAVILACILVVTGPTQASGAEAALAPIRADRVVAVGRTDLLREFRRVRATGTIVVRQRGRIDRTAVVGERRSRLRILPSSTFKIPNSLIAIDSGIVSGPTQVLPGPHPNYLVDGKPLLSAVCEGTLTVTQAFRNSCIPIYQGIARQVGTLAYLYVLRAMRYGNARVDTVPVDDFWLHGGFAISAREQVAFLERLRRGELPVAKKAIRDVREMMVVERKQGWVLRGKTGYVFAQGGNPRRGWWVGSVERRGQTSTFALNIDMQRDDLIPQRVMIAKRILTRLGAFSNRRR